MAAALPNAAHSAGGRRPGTPLIALAAGGVFGVAQTLVAQRCGLLRFAAANSEWSSIELGTLVWLSAASVVLGVLSARRITHARRAQDAFVLGAAGLGSLLAVPLATSSAAWAAIYGGDVATGRVVLHVLLGAGLGLVAAAVAQRYRAAAVGLATGIALTWGFAVLAGLLRPGRPPILDHPDLGIGAAGSGQRFGGLVVALLYGAAIGIVWSTRTLRSRAAAAAIGPALAAAAYLLVLPFGGQSWPWSPIPTALAAVPLAATGAVLAGTLTDRFQRRRD
ncbi:hypothetical protein Athai_03200 [Actinocatenispora thailandica]|uniref:Uncharacterized protein n=1 Tax=Actinocatenispora thailandica TaxID=227318 RepID=A0A7R7DJF3_9ACTN|nr:hypothetical protein [Actinocatenispora thailandica]BCJ32817.1 hypothetical protein Athai_03200 [Actinocatenispora thailandica]